MRKLKLIIFREYLSRVRKRSFLFMTLFGPLLFTSLVILPAWISHQQDMEVKKIGVIDSSKLFIGSLPETRYIKFEYLYNVDVETVRDNWKNYDYYALLYIGHIVSYSPDAIQLMSYRQPALPVLMHISNTIEKQLEQMKLATYGIDDIDAILRAVKTDVTVRSIKWSKQGEDMVDVYGVATVLAYAGGLLIYFFVFMFGTQVLRGVSEEKNNRIVEIIFSSVKPLQLMAGKISGIGIVGLTQFLIWIVLTLVLVFFGKSFLGPDVMQVSQGDPVDLFSASSTFAREQPPISDRTILYSEVLHNLAAINLSVIVFSFIVFFIAGYLLYASLFAAIGALSDTETDAQQFILPVTIPLVIAVIMLFGVIQDPDSITASWLSFIPYTAPVIMMARIPFGVPYWELGLSIGLLVLFIWFHILLSAKIYKTGILIYGKKITPKEIFRWIRYK